MSATINALLIVGEDELDGARVEALEHAIRDLGFRVVLAIEDSRVEGRDDRALARALLGQIVNVTGEELEARARRQYERMGFGPAWEQLDPSQRESYRIAVRT